MRAADGWRDYTLLDASDGDRLERWGDVILRRPDPQVIWPGQQNHPAWQTVDAVYHRSSKGGGSWQYNKPLPERWTIAYGDLRLIVSPTGFKHTGVFPEQAANWDIYRDIIAEAAAANPGFAPKVLNLFAYTGGATLACAAAGAAVTHVDASRGMVAWARENAAASSLADKPIRWIVDDCLKFVQREGRRGKRYDAIILDPPSYGRGPGGEVWKLEDQLFPLIRECAALLEEKPLFFTLNSYTAGLAPGVMGYALNLVLPQKHGGAVSSGEIGLPVEQTGGILPCGATAFWAAKPLRNI